MVEKIIYILDHIVNTQFNITDASFHKLLEPVTKKKGKVLFPSCLGLKLQLFLYIYIYNIDRQTVSLYHNSSVGLDTPDASSWNWNLLNFTLDLVSYRSAISVTYVSLWIKRYYVVAYVCLHFALPDTKVLNSYEELCITRVAAVNSFARALNPPPSRNVHMVIYRQTVSLYHIYSVWLDT